MSNTPRWSGWPGTFCLKCGREDPFEIAMVKRSRSKPRFFVWSSRRHWAISWLCGSLPRRHQRKTHLTQQSRL